jgi:ABC-type lipoprotein export system ATPase subunit/CRP-like cAMP-binding protein
MDNLVSVDTADANRRVLIELNQVVKTFNTPAGDFTALKNVSLQVNAGEFAAVIGKSGSGKSTLINMITGIDRPSLGEVYIGGTPIHNLNEDKMAAWRGRNLGVIFQFFQLLPTLTLVENVMFPMELCNMYPRAERRERAMHLLSLVGLSDQAYKFPSAVSGGQQQRAAIARSLANDPDILIADEPTGSLDSKTADSIFMLFEDFVRQGRTILMVTHDRDLASRVSRVILIADGEITDQHISIALPLLNKGEQVQLLSRLEPVNYAPGATIIKQGDPANHFYIMVKGRADVVVNHTTGGEIVVGHLDVGHYFGEMGILEGGRRLATVRAAADSDVTVMQLDREAFVSMMKNSDLTNNQVADLIRQRAIVTSLSQIGTNKSQLDALSKSATYQDGVGSEKLMASLQDKWEVKTYQPEEVILGQDDVILGMYIVAKGNVDVVDVVQGVHVKTLQTSEFFGARSSILQKHKGCIVQAGKDGDVEIVFINQADLDKLVPKDTSAEKSLVTMATGIRLGRPDSKPKKGD